MIIETREICIDDPQTLFINLLLTFNENSSLILLFKKFKKLPKFFGFLKRNDLQITKYRK